MVKRYDEGCCEGHICHKVGGTMEPSDDGDYVLFEDYQQREHDLIATIVAMLEDIETESAKGMSNDRLFAILEMHGVEID